MSAPHDIDPLDAETRAALLRWRLALGPAAEKVSPSFALEPLAAAAKDIGLDEARVGDLDRALGFVYDEKRATLAASRPYLPTWLAAVREFFRGEVVALVQRDAIEKRNLRELLFEPETLPLLERNVELVATLVSAKGLVPDRAKSIAREIVGEVVRDVERRLAPRVRSAVLGALRRDPLRAAHSPPNLDARRTIRKNLRGWDRVKKRLVPERLYFVQNRQRKHAYDVIVLVDQSASMAESVVYAAIMASIFASIDALRTRLVFFDTEVVDATALLDDPVDVIFAAQLGGGTDIHRALAYAEEHLVERPERTLLVLVSDLMEGGDREGLVRRAARLVEGRVTMLALLALSDGGKPAYDHEIAQALVEVGVPCFGASPSALPELLERALSGQTLKAPEER